MQGGATGIPMVATFETNNPAQAKGPESDRSPGQRWQDQLALSLKELWIKTGRTEALPNSIEYFRATATDGSRVTISHQGPQMTAGSIDDWQIHVKRANRIAVSSAGEARPPALVTEYYDLRGSPSGEYHLFREIDERSGTDDLTIGDGLQRLVVELLPTERQKSRGA
jgi:hypothetical protein